jgi:hypothetical protein
MVLCCGQALFGIDVSDVMQDLLISDLSKGDYTRATCRLGLIHPFYHPQSQVGKLAISKQYHVVLMNGTYERGGYNYGFMNYECLFEEIVHGLSEAFPSRYVPSLAPRSECLIVALVWV